MWPLACGQFGTALGIVQVPEGRKIALPFGEANTKPIKLWKKDV